MTTAHHAHPRIGDSASRWRVDMIEHLYTFDDGREIDVKLAWCLEGATKNVSVASLVSYLHEDCWGAFTPLEVGHAEPHWTLTVDADLLYPIIIADEPGVERHIIDGRHRLLKAWLLGHDMISVRFIDFEEMMEKCSRDTARFQVLEMAKGTVQE